MEGFGCLICGIVLVYAFTLRNMKPLNKIIIEWSPKFAYVIGLIATDGNLSKDGRHITFTSKDKQLAEIFVKSLGIKNKIGMKASGITKEKKYFNIQFGDVNFYRFLGRIGLTANKSKTLGAIGVPDKYFFDFLRGSFDGDGCFYSYWDPRWRSSFMFYTEFISASLKHITWLQKEIEVRLGISGHITRGGSRTCYQLKYAKNESLKLLKKIYYKKNLPTLERKRVKVYNALVIDGENP